LAGLIVPDEGRVILDGVDAHKYSDDELCRHVAYMSNDMPVFRGTIRDNLSAFRDEGYIQRSIDIIKILKADKEILQLAKGYDTFLVDTHSDPISPGLKQRIAIARVLAMKPKLLLFDNADKSLDNKGYEAIVELLGLLKRKATIVIVSDDRNMLEFANEEYVLENGKILRQDFKYDSKFYDLVPNQEFKL